MNTQEQGLTPEEILALALKAANAPKSGPANPQNHKRDKTKDLFAAATGYVKFLFNNETKPKAERASPAKVAFVKRQFEATKAKLSQAQLDRMFKSLGAKHKGTQFRKV